MEARAQQAIVAGSLFPQTQQATGQYSRVNRSANMPYNPAALNPRRDESNLRALADYAIDRHYPDLVDIPRKYSEFLRAVMDRQASLIARWQHVGFIHGVMNTDNVAISGETIDYGPCAFMNAYDPETVFSSIDHAGRYAYSNQPAIA